MAAKMIQLRGIISNIMRGSWPPNLLFYSLLFSRQCENDTRFAVCVDELASLNTQTVSLYIIKQLELWFE